MHPVELHELRAISSASRVFRLDNRVTAYDLFGLGERTIGHLQLAATKRIR